MASNSAKLKGSFAFKVKVSDSWFTCDNYIGIIKRIKGDNHNVYCCICSKPVSIAHMGENDLIRHCE